MKTQKTTYNQEEYELDNQYNEEESYLRIDSSIWYN